MISEGYFRRHQQALGGDRDVVLLDVAQEYVLEHLRREGLFDRTLVFKGGTALRKFVFGAAGRFSVDLDFGLASDDPNDVGLALDFLEDAEIHGVRIALANRDGPNADLRIATPLGDVVRPARVSVRKQRPWLPPVTREPCPFEHLDRGLAAEFRRAQLAVLDIREIAAEKIAAFWRRRHARDVYDLGHLAQLLQTQRADDIAELAALKIYFDVTVEGLGHAPETLADVFSCQANEVRGADDLGELRASASDVAALLERCRQRYASFAQLIGTAAELATTCNARDTWRASQYRDQLTARLARGT